MCRKAGVARCRFSLPADGLEIAQAREVSPLIPACSQGKAVERAIVHTKADALRPRANDCVRSTRTILLARAFPSSELLLPRRTRRRDRTFPPNRSDPEIQCSRDVADCCRG